MKKIGIMSMQRIHNYGSFLQAYGLNMIIRSLGYDVVFVDYSFEKDITDNRQNVLGRIINKIWNNRNITKAIRKELVLHKYHKKFLEEYIPALCNNYTSHDKKEIDALVIGSDEVFNCLQPYPVGYSRELFGKNYENIPVISYAACFGQTNYERLEEKSIDKEVASMLKKFKAISVRDNNSFNTIVKLTGIKPNENIDPVLAYDFSNDEIDNVKLKDYIIVYAYTGRLTKDEKKKIKAFAKKHNKKIVSFGMYQDISDIEIIVNPFEIFAYFKHADFIITDTFHGSIFSIKTHANFCSIVRESTEGNNNKLVDLLNKLSMQDRIITNINDLETFYQKKPDYSLADKFIMKEQAKTREYLEVNLKDNLE